MASSFFDPWVRWQMERNGTSHLLPVFYYDTTSVSAVFTAQSARIKELLPHPAMQPLEWSPGRGLVVITGFEYRRCDLAPYNEVSIAFLVAFGNRPLPGISAARALLSRTIPVYIWQLPVTTEEARVGGIDLAGYPKFLAQIDFARDDDWITCTLAEGGQEILQLRGRRLQTDVGRQLRYVTYTMVQGSPLIVDVLVNPIAYAETLAGGAAELTLGTGHAVSETLGQLGLGQRNVVYQYSPVNEAVLFPARNVLE